jgi:hypothetical protein
MNGPSLVGQIARPDRNEVPVGSVWFDHDG